MVGRNVVGAGGLLSVLLSAHRRDVLGRVECWVVAALCRQGISPLNPPFFTTLPVSLNSLTRLSYPPDLQAFELKTSWYKES